MHKYKFEKKAQCMCQYTHTKIMREEAPSLKSAEVNRGEFGRRKETEKCC